MKDTFKTVAMILAAVGCVLFVWQCSVASDKGYDKEMAHRASTCRWACSEHDGLSSWKMVYSGIGPTNFAQCLCADTTILQVF